jgi:bacterioferritin (cytochrome b1)
MLLGSGVIGFIEGVVVLDAELMEKISIMSSFEKHQADSLKPTIDMVKNSLIQVVLNKIMLDSMKHAHMLQAIMDLDAGEVVWHIDKQAMLKTFNRHLENEEKMLESIHGLLDKVEDEKMKPLFYEILADEEQHHRMLRRLIDIVESIDVSDEEWEEFYRKRLQDEWPDF